jgi:hypothetical protein
MKKNKYTDWHRLFGITLMDYFTHSKYRVELEKDLSIQQQFLDVVILEQQQGRLPNPLPDGLENLKAHNLLTYKSHQESLRDWSLDELLGHYVNYRKQERKGKKLLPARDFQLYAVCTRFPDALEKQYPLRQVKPGVYRVRWGSRQVRLIVTSQVPKTPNNTLWHLFSHLSEQVAYAQKYHHWQNPHTSSVVNQLFHKYFQEGISMPYTMADFESDTRKWLLKSVKKELARKTFSPTQVLNELFSPEEVADALPPKAVKKLSPKLVKVLSPEEVVKQLSPAKIVNAVSPEKLLNAIPQEAIEAYLAKQKKSRRKSL